jgi:hypothetical protein
MLLIRYLCLRLSSALLLHPSVRQEELTMSFVARIIPGLVAGFIVSRLVNREHILPDVFVGLSGASGNVSILLFSGW